LMKDNIYATLARHLDNLPGGYPSTDSGVELRILHRLFTPTEAELALHLTLIPEAPRVIARRANLTPSEASRRLEEMAKKGLIFRIESKGQLPQYMAAQYVVGIWEFHVNSLDRAFIQDMNEYAPTLFKEAWKVPQLRTVPVGRSLTPQLEVFTYERAEALVRDHRKAVVAPCICRRERTMMEEGCGRPEETCLSFGMAAQYYDRNGLGRVIDRDEALAILKTADEAGLVLQPGNAQEAAFICCCCGCCCGVLRSIKQYPRPASLVSTPFVATANPDTCEGCGLCLDRCQMEALRLVEDRVSLDVGRCIGCGLCVSTCPTGSLALIRKPESGQPGVPKTHTQSALQLARSRGKLKSTELVMMQVKSKVDRLFARR